MSNIKFRWNLKRNQYPRIHGVHGLVGVVLILLISNCSTLFNAGPQPILVDHSKGNPVEIRVFPPSTVTKAFPYNALTPEVVHVFPSTFSPLKVEITDECYPQESIQVPKDIHLSYWLNIFNGWGFIVDSVTGSMWQYDDHLRLTASPISKECEDKAKSIVEEAPSKKSSTRSNEPPFRGTWAQIAGAALVGAGMYYSLGHLVSDCTDDNCERRRSQGLLTTWGGSIAGLGLIFYGAIQEKKFKTWELQQEISQSNLFFDAKPSEKQYFVGYKQSF